MAIKLTFISFKPDKVDALCQVQTEPQSRATQTHSKIYEV